MTDAAKLRMTPRQIGGFAEWSILVEWPDGREQNINGFDSLAQIRAWIARDSRAWIDKALADRARLADLGL
jgi:hypothetical protein